MSAKPKRTSRSRPYYVCLPSRFGSVCIVWQPTATGPLVERIVLPTPNAAAETLLRRAYASARQRWHPVIRDLARDLHSFLEGEAVEFSLDIVALDKRPDFQRRVLLAEHGIPRGQVSTYGLIAEHLGAPGGARAVGQALARNPFPLVIPCHRAIRSDGTLGGFQGGLEIKRALLQMEGVQVARGGRVLEPRWFYD